ncbi:hypothetical protein PBI_GRAYSON_276 [Rhodococcus phage Grayson]|nr:hypothetical protein PBI_GRAYSON_276 [Rhodococcus phage Grayson]
MSNKYGNRDSGIILEFNRSVGTQALFYPDGRVSNATVESEIIDYVCGLRKCNPDLKLLGFSKRGSDKITPFPHSLLVWANYSSEREI